MVCSQLGFYSGAEEALGGSIFGPIDSEFSYSDVRCYGNEDKLEDCLSSPMPFCPPAQGAAVICNKTYIKGIDLIVNYFGKMLFIKHFS